MMSFHISTSGVPRNQCVIRFSKARSARAASRARSSMKRAGTYVSGASSRASRACTERSASISGRTARRHQFTHARRTASASALASSGVSPNRTTSPEDRRSAAETQCRPCRMSTASISVSGMAIDQNTNSTRIEFESTTTAQGWAGLRNENRTAATPVRRHSNTVVVAAPESVGPRGKDKGCSSLR